MRQLFPDGIPVCCSVGSPVPPAVEPAFQDVRQGMGHSVTLRCTMVKGSPMKVATSVWRFNGSLLAQPLAEQQDYSELKVDSVSRETSGSYECSISNDVGVSACLFQVSGKSQDAHQSRLLDGVMASLLLINWCQHSAPLLLPLCPAFCSGGMIFHKPAGRAVSIIQADGPGAVKC